MGVKSFVLGFGLGVGSGIALRALAEKDYEPIRDALKRSATLAQQFGDVTLDTVGRLKESFEDMTAQLRAQPHREKTATSGKKRNKKVSAKSGRKKKATKSRRSETSSARVLHS